MELDELREKWTQHDRKLDEILRLNRHFLRQSYTRRARTRLRILAAMLALGSVLIFGIIVALGRFIALHWKAPKLTVPAILLDVAAIATFAVLIAQIALALNINYDQPVAAIQKRLETLRRLRIRYVQAIFLTASLAWVPIFIFVTKIQGFGTSWIAINVAVGLLVLAAGYWIAYRLGRDTAFGRKFLRDLAGYNLNAASDFLATLADFERDYSPQERSSIREYSPEE